ncbi:MAG: hypothetical protein M1831_001859 [Alyxoria varia]|nr:MAG: hypothetical protein M1831_001859 [Alyxoria varia]
MSSRKTMMRQLDISFANDTDADLIIECQSRQFKVRQYMLKFPPEVMGRTVYPNGPPEPRHFGILNLDYEHPVVVRALLQYFYRTDYTDDESESCNGIMVFHVAVHDIARRHCCEGLQNLAKERFELDATKCERNRFNELENAIGIAYRSSDAGSTDIREAICRVVYVRRREIFFGNQDKENWDFVPLTEQQPAFAVAFCNFQLLANRLAECRARWHCPHCRRARLMDLSDAAMAICSKCDTEYDLTGVAGNK